MTRLLLPNTIACAALLALPCAALAATYTVGPSGRQYTQLSTLVSSVNLEPGDVVLVDGGRTYGGNVVVGSNDSGAPGNPVTIRWNRAAGSARPVLSGGSHTIKFQQSNHVVFEGFEVTGGSSSCIFSEAHDVTVRDVIVRDCPSHGILGADNNSGSFTLEYSEIRNSGSGSQRHPIYMQSDQVAWPGSVFLMRYNYVHSGNGGNLLKNRHERALIYYNWFENSAYQELELIGPDCETQQRGWSPGLRREDVDLVGNVIVHGGSWRNAIRAGGDLNGRSQGRLRLVNNTILFTRGGNANAVLVQLGLESLEMHNNVIHQTGSGAAPNILRVHAASEVETPYCAPTSREPWTSGRKVAGSNNWVQSSAAMVPGEWTGTLRGGDPDAALLVDESHQLSPRELAARGAQRGFRRRQGLPSPRRCCCRSSTRRSGPGLRSAARSRACRVPASISVRWRQPPPVASVGGATARSRSCRPGRPQWRPSGRVQRPQSRAGRSPRQRARRRQPGRMLPARRLRGATWSADTCAPNPRP